MLLQSVSLKICCCKNLPSIVKPSKRQIALYSPCRLVDWLVGVTFSKLCDSAPYWPNTTIYHPVYPLLISNGQKIGQITFWHYYPSPFLGGRGNFHKKNCLRKWYEMARKICQVIFLTLWPPLPRVGAGGGGGKNSPKIFFWHYDPPPFLDQNSIKRFALFTWSSFDLIDVTLAIEDAASKTGKVFADDSFSDSLEAADFLATAWQFGDRWEMFGHSLWF